MNVGDLVRVRHIDGNLTNGRSNVGFIMKIDRITPARGYKKRYWVKLFGGWNIGPVPFTERQLEIVSKSS